MRGIIVSDNQQQLERISSILEFICVVPLSSLELALHFFFKPDDIVVIALDKEEESVSLEVFLGTKFRILFLYDSNRNNYSLFEQFCYTVFIPNTASDRILREGLGRVICFRQEDDDDDRLVGSSNAIETVRYQINTYAKTNLSIHLSGSTGTGKNVAARLIHKASGLKNKMVYVNCGSFLNTSLCESSFFGYTKGSFTGSTSSRNGYLKSANNSTLFLDEIENMPHNIQELLLDAIDRHVFRAIGSDVEIHSDFRIITASNMPLDTLRTEGRLRSDFYYRIAQRKISMPDLDNHKEDIPELVQYYEGKHNIIKNRVRDYSVLTKKNWPGNIRELFNEVSLIHEENSYNSFFREEMTLEKLGYAF